MSSAVSAVMVAVLVASSGALSLPSRPPRAEAQSASTEGLRSASHKKSPECSKQEKFVGEVKRGQDFEQDIGGGLVFYLRARHDPAIEGWRIEIRPKELGRNYMTQDYAGLLNPPYHYYNSTDVDVSYDVTAKQAVDWGQREVRFPLTESEVVRAGELVGLLQSNTGAVFNKALKEMESMRSGKAVFNIMDSRLGGSGPENGSRGRIEWLKFELRISFPCDFPAEKPR